MTTVELLSLVRKKILETTEEIVDNDTLLIYASQRQQDIYKRVFPNSKVTTSSSIALTAGSGTLPTNFGTLYSDPYDAEGNFYPELNIEDFQKQTLERGSTVEAGVLKIYPTTVASVTIKYYPTLATITTSQDPTVDTYFDKCLVLGTVSDAYEDLQDHAMAKFYDDKYEFELQRRNAVMSNYEENNKDNGQLFSDQNLLGGGLNVTF